MRTHDRRLRALEDAGPRRLVLVVVDPEETPAEALARDWPQGPPPRAEIVFITGVAPRLRDTPGAPGIR